MSYHVNNVVKEAFSHLRNIAKIRKNISGHIAEVLIHSFVSSKLDFVTHCSTVSPNMKLISCKIFRMQQLELYIACLRKYDHITPTLRMLHWFGVLIYCYIDQHESKLEKREIVWKHDARRAECFHTISSFSNFQDC
jgi:hypothetical protein